MGKNGGKRPGAGRPKGSKNAKTLEKEEARRYLRELVIAELEPMVRAQVENAKGLNYLVARSKRGGKFKRVDWAPPIGQRVGTDDDIIEVWAERPNVQAFTDLLNRAIDKPAEQPLPVDLNWQGGEDLLQRLLAGRERVKKAKH